MPSKFRALRKGIPKPKELAKLNPDLKPAEAITEEELNNLLANLNEETKPATAAVTVEETKKDEVQTVNSKVYHKAYNIFYDASQRKFIQVTLEYDLATGYSKIVETKPIADNQAVAIYKIQNIITLKILRQEEK